MRKYVLISWILFSISCAEPKQVSTERYSIQEISTELGNNYSDVVKDLKSLYALDNITRASNDVPINPMRKFIGEIEKYKLSTLTYYKFDNTKFYEDPSEENLQKCMEPLDKLNIIAERDGFVEWRLIVKKQEGLWTMEQATYEYGKVISWLGDSLYRAGTKKCKIFLLGSTREFVTYEKNGDPLYFKITGEPILPGHLCEYFVEQYKAGQENKKYIEEHPELFGDPVPQNK